jgi:hypothetical protein
MPTRNCARWLGLLAVWLLAGATGWADDAKVEVKEVKFTGYTDTIKQFKGKIVVVDFWSDT